MAELSQQALELTAVGAVTRVLPTARLMGFVGGRWVKFGLSAEVVEEYTPRDRKRPRRRLTCETFGARTVTHAKAEDAIEAAREMARAVTLPPPVASGRKVLLDALDELAAKGEAA